MAARITWNLHATFARSGGDVAASVWVRCQRWRPGSTAVMACGIRGPMAADRCGWHAPQFLTREWDTPRSSVSDLAAYLVFVVATSVVLSWVTNTARGSVWLAILAHTAVNFTLTALPLITGRGLPSLWPATTGIGVLALLAIAITGGRLGHRTPDTPQATNPPSRPTATSKSEPFRA